jgi:acyl-coenzyme A thioesterase PaaI-like protein
MAEEFPTVEKMNAWSEGKLPGLLGVEVVSVEPGRVRGRLPVRPGIVAHTGFLSAPTVIGLADTLCAYGVSTK